MVEHLTAEESDISLIALGFPQAPLSSIMSPAAALICFQEQKLW